jgi:hypothetical protein
MDKLKENGPAKDEHYILDIVDEVCGIKGSRQHRFDFLRGDTGSPLPVDAFYADRMLAVEYHERQHTESVPHMDKRMTVSGVRRGEQRRKYDQRRRDVLSAYGIRLVVLDYSLFACNSHKRLTRADRAADMAVIQKALATAPVNVSTTPPELNAMETAAEAACDIFNGLNSADKEALTIRLVALGALHSGEGTDYIARVCEAAQNVVIEHLDRISGGGPTP